MGRYEVRPHLHPTLGPTFQIVDTQVKTITGSEVVAVVGGSDGRERAQAYADAMNKGDAAAQENRRGRRGPECGHSACSQNYIDTGETVCLRTLEAEGCQ